ncbi:hypothetical protein [Rhizobium leguminosarum]|uniref:hypothetical protein n=1 Tax=Rhizobium leguminosarum TaxID=384 RepID=UPI003ECF96A2
MPDPARTRPRRVEKLVLHARGDDQSQANLEIKLQPKRLRRLTGFEKQRGSQASPISLGEVHGEPRIARQTLLREFPFNAVLDIASGAGIRRHGPEAFAIGDLFLISGRASF